MGAPLRILCLEDQQDDYELVKLFLERSNLNFVSRRVETRPQYLEAISEFRPDVILSDHTLPQFNSLEALRICREQSNAIAFILVTGAVSEEFAAECMKHGAQDYVLKSNLMRLGNSVRNAVKHRELELAKQHAAEQLEEQNRHLLKINHELDSFVYSVSHDLRAPLMSILGLINLTQYENDLDVIRDYHKKIVSTISKLDETLKEILDYSRNSRQELVLDRVNVNAAIFDNLEKLRYMPGFESVKVTIGIKNTTILITDRYRLTVILNNLISNAIKYQDKTRDNSFLKINGHVRQSVFELTFEDNGIGIDQSVVPRIFDMFFRATEYSEGSGLGLYIVKEAVEKLHGTISVNTAPGVGTKFTIEIPNSLL